MIFDKDLLAPPTVVALVLLFGCLCCFYNEKRFGLEFSVNSLFLIVAGIIATIIGGLAGVFLSNFPKVGSFSFNHDTYVTQEIKVNGIKTFIFVLFQIVTLLLLFLHIRNLTGYSNWMLAVARYRALTGRLADVNDISIRMPIITKNMVQISKMIGVVFAYIVGNNLVAAKRKISLNWLPVILYTMTTFMQGDRSNMIRLWIVALVTAYTIHRRSVGWRKSRETKRIIRTMILSIFAIGVIFFAFREIVGRSSEFDPLYYVTFYAGSPIAVLNQMWEQPIVRPEVFGQRTLYYFNESTTALFGWPGRYNFYYDFFKSPNGTFIGNAPTVLRPAFVEFGPLGYFFVMICFGAFFTLLYCKCRKKRGVYPIDIHLLIYAYIAYVFFMYFYSTFYDFLSHVFIKFIIYILLICWALFGWNFKQKYRFSLNRYSRKE